MGSCCLWPLHLTAPHASPHKQAENDGLRLQELQDRARIKQLLAVARPVEQRMTRGGGGENARPLPAPLLPRSGSSAAGAAPAGPAGCRSPWCSRQEGGRAGSAGGGGPSSGSGSAGAAPAARIVYVDVPAVQGEALALKCEALAAQLAEQKRFAAERVAALQEDRAIRERDAAAHAAALGAAAEELSARLAAAEEALRTTTRDYILAKQARDAAEAEAAAARADAAEARAGGERALAAAREEAAQREQRLRRELEGDHAAATQARA